MASFVEIEEDDVLQGIGQVFKRYRSNGPLA
jgi:hypothetical protein